MDKQQLLNTERIRADLSLLLVALVWGSAFVAQRLAAGEMGVFLFNGLRFATGALVLLPLAWRSRNQPGARAALRRKNLYGIFLLGAILFAGAGLQQLGMRYTTAGNAGFITGLYVVLIPILLAVFWRQPTHSSIWLAAGFAAAGMFLLSTGGSLRVNPGDAIELAGAVLWALHVIWIGRMVQRVDVLPLAVGQYLLCSLLSLGAAAIWENASFSNLAVVVGAVLYTGVLSIGLGYTLQAVGQKVAPPADAAILLSGEAVFAALFGWVLLGEQLTPLQLLGCGLMFGGMLVAQAQAFRRTASLPRPLDAPIPPDQPPSTQN